jgi:aspartyl-tRNA(Asn)/glutamyl-tRNA(Gln) amidotransferase subunit B
LSDNQELSAYFEAAAKGARKPKAIANYVLNDLLSALAASEKTIAECPIPAEQLDHLASMVDEGKISSKQAKEVFGEMFSTGRAAATIVEEKGMQQESDPEAIVSLCSEVILANPKSVEAYKSGKAAAINFLKGQVMKLSKGKANPNVVSEVLAKLLQ